MKKNFMNDEVRILLQIHDELVFEVKEKMVEKFAVFLKPLMENAGADKFQVPIIADVKTGLNWGEMQKMII